MKKCFFIFIFVFLFLATNTTQASEKKLSRWFVGLGGLGGFEVLELKQFGGGVSLPFGYELNENLSVYGLLDTYFTRDIGINYSFVSLSPALTYRFYKWFSVYGSVGYTLMHPTQNGRIWDYRPNTNSFFHGLKGEIGFGINKKLADNVVLSPQVGGQYYYIANDSLFVPAIRLNLILLL